MLHYIKLTFLSLHPAGRNLLKNATICFHVNNWRKPAVFRDSAVR